MTIPLKQKMEHTYCVNYVFKTNSQVKYKIRCWLIVQNVKSILIIFVQKNYSWWQVKKIKGKPRCADCMANKSFFDKIGDKRELEITAPQFLIDRIL